MKFFYHYNKPKSQQTGIPTISLHYKDACHFIREIEINVKTKSKINKRQPRFVMVGEANKIKIKNHKAIIS